MEQNGGDTLFRGVRGAREVPARPRNLVGCVRLSFLQCAFDFQDFKNRISRQISHSRQTTTIFLRENSDFWVFWVFSIFEMTNFRAKIFFVLGLFSVARHIRTAQRCSSEDNFPLR